MSRNVGQGHRAAALHLRLRHVARALSLRTPRKLRRHVRPVGHRHGQHLRPSGVRRVSTSLVLCTLLRHCTCTFTWYVVSGFRTLSLVLVLLLWVSRVFQRLSPTTLANRIEAGRTGRAVRCPPENRALPCTARCCFLPEGARAPEAGRARSLPWEDPPVVDIVHTGSRGHLLGPRPGQGYIPREVGCPLQVLHFVHSQCIWREGTQGRELTHSWISEESRSS